MNGFKVATVGNPGMHTPTMLAALPGMSAFATGMMKKEIEKLELFRFKPPHKLRVDR